MSVAMGVRPTWSEIQGMSAQELMTWLVETKTVKDYGEWDAKPEFVPAEG